MAEDTRKRPDFSADYSSDASHQSADPLAELARLIGQSDPFTDLSKQSPRQPLTAIRNGDRPAPEWLARPAAPEHEEYEPAPAPHQAYARPSRAAPHDPHAPAGYEAENGRAAEGGDYVEPEGGYDHYPPDDRYRVSLPSGQYDPDSYYAEDGHLPPQGEESVIHRRRGGLITIAAVVGLAIVGTAGAFGYRTFVSKTAAPATPPVIKADPTPAKTVPAPATTASVDPAKPIQDRVAPPSPERMVPREEQPVSLPIAPAAAPVAPRAMAPQPSAQAAAPLVSPPTPTSVNEPKKVKTVIIRQDNGGAGAAAMPSGPAAAPPAQTRTPAAPMAIAPQSNARTKIATRTPPAQAVGGAYVVQVSAQKTEDEARASYHALQQKYPGVLSGREANIRRADLGDKGVYYRAQIGPFATADQANALCGDLKAAGGQCIVQKN
jgi:hypothetical protein